jgi:hypothetical protein
MSATGVAQIFLSLWPAEISTSSNHRFQDIRFVLFNKSPYINIITNCSILDNIEEYTVQFYPTLHYILLSSCYVTLRRCRDLQNNMLKYNCDILYAYIFICRNMHSFTIIAMGAC